jgi:hypothetical protein
MKYLASTLSATATFLAGAVPVLIVPLIEPTSVKIGLALAAACAAGACLRAGVLTSNFKSGG